MKNPFTNATVYQVAADPRVYRADIGGEVGSKEKIITRSEMLDLAACPSRWRKGGSNGEDTDSTEWGTWLDTLILCKERMQEMMAVKPETYPDTKTGAPKDWNGNSTWCKKWMADHEGLITLKRHELDEVGIAATRLLNDDRLFEIIRCSQKQVWLKGDYRDKATGLVVPVKALLDLVPNKTHPEFGKSLADLKTCRSANVRAFSRQIFQMGWHVQAAWYLDLYTAATGEDRCEWRFVISENKPPYQPGRRLLSTEYLELGRTQYKQALELYCRCLATNTWPGFDDGANTINGWSIAEPEAYMITAGVDYSYEPGWMSDKPESKDDGLPVTP